MDDSVRDAAAALIDEGSCSKTAITRTLRKFGNAALRYALQRGIRIVPLIRGERYQQRSGALRRLGVDVDAWPAPPAGLFVVEERTVYLRSHSPMTVAHEFGHALDCALGDGVYRSSIDPQLRTLFAEGVRAYVQINDPASFWPRATRERLRRIDPGMYGYVEQLFQTAFIVAPSNAADSTDHALRQ